MAVFEPMPFKGDENMLVDAKDRAALDADEGDDQLLMGFGDNNNDAGKDDNKPKDDPVGGGGLLDLDTMLAGPSGGDSNTMGGI